MLPVHDVVQRRVRQGQPQDARGQPGSAVAVVGAVRQRHEHPEGAVAAACVSAGEGGAHELGAGGGRRREKGEESGEELMHSIPGQVREF